MLKTGLVILLVFILGLFLLSLDLATRTGDPIYGVSFSRFHADELNLDWEQTYLAILNELKVKHFRFSAHWPLTEPEEGRYNFKELDLQIEEAKKHDASVILAVGRRLPGWPECHEPEWAKDLAKDEKQEKLLKYIETTVNRYKNHTNVIYWQVENEPFLTFFSQEACGELDPEFLDKEIALVKQLDPSRPILVTDSGEFGAWHEAYRRGDAFGTTMYLYIWNRIIGPFRYPITPAFFRIKSNIMRILFGSKPKMVIELSNEPWLLRPIVDTPLNVQLDRMDINKFNEILDFSSKTGFNRFYLWGVEWWYWMKLQGHDEFWDRSKGLFHE